MDKKIYTENLAKINTKNGNIVDWKNSVGLNVKFTYGEILGEFKIVEYIKSNNSNVVKLKIRYKNNEISIPISSVLIGRIGNLLKVRTSEFRLDMKQNLKDRKRDLTIIDREYRKHLRKDNDLLEKQKWYKYHCNKCGNEDWVIEGSICGQKTGCNVCGESYKKLNLVLIVYMILING